MKHWLSLVGISKVEDYIELAQFAEKIGFYGVAVADHLLIPSQSVSVHSNSKDSTWRPREAQWPDPWIILTAIGLATSSLRLTTNIYLAALRDPFSTAKAISTASRLTNNRVSCGLAAGWQKEEFEFSGVDFQSRGRRLDETIMVMKKLWSGTEVSHEGEFFQFNGALQQPTPTQPIKIRIGGSSAPALRRAARHDGWMGEPMSKDKLIETVKILENLRAEQKKSEPMDLFFTLMEMPTREIYNELDSMGLSNRVAITPWKRERWLRQGENPEQIEVKKLALIRFAQDVIDI
ncbi:hypothetical protein GPB2148_2995 [marine gamma proteobacterium HTCC2148]|nr:hypothetical protein GPB2148_2995 [marine gamma proteobacterium HTCC2148]